MAWIMPVLSILGDSLSKNAQIKDDAALKGDLIESERLKNAGQIYQGGRSSPNYSAILSVQRPKTDNGLGQAIQALGSLGSLFGGGGGDEGSNTPEFTLDSSKSDLLNDDFEGAKYDPDKTAGYKKSLSLVEPGMSSGGAPTYIGAPAQLGSVSTPMARHDEDPDWTDPELTRRLSGRLRL